MECQKNNFAIFIARKVCHLHVCCAGPPLLTVSVKCGVLHSLILNAAEEFGGMQLESKAEAEEWVKYILGQSLGPDGPLKVPSLSKIFFFGLKP